MKIIDFAKKGNVVRFYLGADDCDDYYGDDWDDTPYEHNAGPVYDRFVEDYVDVVFPFDWIVMQPSEDWHYDGNTPYCKNDMKARHCPCIVAVSGEPQKTTWEDSYTYWAASDAPGVEKFYFGDRINPTENRLILR